MSDNLYPAGALLLGSALLYFGWRLAALKLAASTARSKQRARLAPASDRVLLAAAVALMMLNKNLKRFSPGLPEPGRLNPAQTDDYDRISCGIQSPRLRRGRVAS
jgi:hypothetical protein